MHKSLAIVEKIHGKNNIHCAIVLSGIGTIYHKMKSFQEAINYYEKCLAIK